MGVGALNFFTKVYANDSDQIKLNRHSIMRSVAVMTVVTLFVAVHS